jgi:HEAT repeat protein
MIGHAQVQAGVRMLFDTARTKSHALRELAISALGELEDASAADVLGELATDPAEELDLRLSAVDALVVKHDPRRKHALEVIAERTDGEVRRAALDGLADIIETRSV